MTARWSPRAQRPEPGAAPSPPRDHRPRPPRHSGIGLPPAEAGPVFGMRVEEVLGTELDRPQAAAPQVDRLREACVHAQERVARYLLVVVTERHRRAAGEH